MKKHLFSPVLFSAVALFLICAGPAASTPAQASASGGLPSTYSEFRTRCQTAAKTPQGAVKMYFDAVFCYLDPQRRAEASKMLRFIMHADANWEGSQKYVTFVRRLKDPHYRYIFQSFAAGTSPENGYRMSPDNYTLHIVRTSPEQDHLRVFLRSSGADLDRRVWVRQFPDGLWYVINNSDTYVKVREPAAATNNNQHDADFDAAPPANHASPKSTETAPAPGPSSAENEPMKAGPAGGVDTATPPAPTPATPQDSAPDGADNSGQGNDPAMSTW